MDATEKIRVVVMFQVIFHPSILFGLPLSEMQGAGAYLS